MIEIWRDIKDYEGIYQVSNFGRVKSLNYRNTGRAEVLQPSIKGNGYLQVGLWKNGERNLISVHRLVAEAFIPNPENKPEINHKSEVKTDNRVENLEWIWHKDNINYGTHNERVTKAKSKKVLQFTLDGEFVREWESTAECGRNSFDQSVVSRCCNRKLKSHKGFIWRYK